ncbi:MAG: hypothetical protein GOP50_11890, partial [Candidatus Heimdallarchaeota archaeon]|nr:hypothetical protein [Candidatus Heimdallarchaeota archaeon]
NYTLSNFLGQAVLLDLWATWCGPCEVSNPYLQDLYMMYPDNVNITEIFYLPITQYVDAGPPVIVLNGMRFQKQNIT